MSFDGEGALASERNNGQDWTFPYGRASVPLACRVDPPRVLINHSITIELGNQRSD